MAELGIDLGGHTSKLYADVASEAWDYLITVCDDANERCPWVPGSVKRLHWSFPDPSRAIGIGGGATRGLPPGARSDPGAPDRLAPRSVSPARLVAYVCAAQVCAQIGAYTWPALLPGLPRRVAAHQSGGGLDHRHLLRGLHGVGARPRHAHRPRGRARGLSERRGPHGGEPPGVRRFRGRAVERRRGACPRRHRLGRHLHDRPQAAGRPGGARAHVARGGRTRREHRHRGRDLVRVRGHDRPVARLARRFRGGRDRRDRRAG